MILQYAMEVYENRTHSLEFSSYKVLNPKEPTLPLMTSYFVKLVGLELLTVLAFLLASNVTSTQYNHTYFVRTYNLNEVFIKKATLKTLAF